MTLLNFNNNCNKSTFVGFNLIELMIAIAVLAVIVAASVIKYKDYVKRSEINHAINYANNVKEKIMLYYLDNEKIPDAAIINNDFSSANLDENTKKYVSNIFYVAGGDISGLPNDVKNQIGNAQGVKWLLRVTINPDIVPSAEVGYVFSVINNVETLMPFTVGIDQKFRPKGYLSACSGNQILNNGVCSCPTGTSLIGGVCSGGVTCSAGQYLNTATYSCSACQSGTYSSGGTVTSCSANTLVANCATYSTTANQCSTCINGYVVSNGACVLSVSCPAGKYFNTVANSCLACGAGTYSLGGTVTSCTQNTTVANCTSYSTTENKCASCAAGYYFNTATNSCVVCAAGTYSSGGAVNSCIPNTPVQYCASYYDKFDLCRTFACPPGQFVMTDPSVCVPCSPNYYSPGGNTNLCFQVTPVANCTAYSPGEDKCISCGNGTFLVNGSCIACQEGEYLDAATSTCKSCGVNQYGIGKFYYDNQLGCVDCRPACAACTNFNNCTACLPGFYTDIVHATNNPANDFLYPGCTPCPIGCATCTSATKCNSCTPGRYGVTCQNSY